MTKRGGALEASPEVLDRARLPAVRRTESRRVLLINLKAASEEIRA
jgi:hypothetical protein